MAAQCTHLTSWSGVNRRLCTKSGMSPSLLVMGGRPRRARTSGGGISCWCELVTVYACVSSWLCCWSECEFMTMYACIRLRLCCWCECEFVTMYVLSTCGCMYRASDVRMSPGRRLLLSAHALACTQHLCCFGLAVGVYIYRRRWLFMCTGIMPTRHIFCVFGPDLYWWSHTQIWVAPYWVTHISESNTSLSHVQVWVVLKFVIRFKCAYRTRGSCPVEHAWACTWNLSKRPTSSLASAWPIASSMSFSASHVLSAYYIYVCMYAFAYVYVHVHVVYTKKYQTNFHRGNIEKHSQFLTTTFLQVFFHEQKGCITGRFRHLQRNSTPPCSSFSLTAKMRSTCVRMHAMVRT